MATYTKEFFSASTSGKAILVAAITSPGTVIHTCPAGATTKDEIWLYVTNNHTVVVDLTLEWGGTTDVDLKRCSVPFKQGEHLIIPGFILNDSGVIFAFASVTNVLSITGFINRITA